MSDSTARVTAATTDPDSPSDMLARYRDGARVLLEAVAGLDASALRARPIAGKMSSLEVLAHIVDADQFMCDRMKRTIATDRPLLLGVDGIAYLGKLHYHDHDPVLDLRLLEVQREQMAANLARLDADAWERDAVHSEVGLLTLQQLLSHAVRHLEEHVDAIAEKRTVLGL